MWPPSLRSQSFVRQCWLVKQSHVYVPNCWMLKKLFLPFIFADGQLKETAEEKDQKEVLTWFLKGVTETWATEHFTQKQMHVHTHTCSTTMENRSDYCWMVNLRRLLETGQIAPFSLRSTTCCKSAFLKVFLLLLKKKDFKGEKGWNELI